MKITILTIRTGMVLLLGVWHARSETTNAALTFYIVSEQKVANGHFIDTPAIPKLGYISARPDLTVTSIRDVFVQTMAKHSGLLDTNGNPKLVPSHALPSLAVQLRTNDTPRFTALTEQALNKRLLIMFG